jgi:hypothetical protein
MSTTVCAFAATEAISDKAKKAGAKNFFMFEIFLLNLINQKIQQKDGWLLLKKCYQKKYSHGFNHSRDAAFYGAFFAAQSLFA